MKILYATDIHEDVEALRVIANQAKRNHSDAMIISGDLVNSAFESPQSFNEHLELYGTLDNYRKQTRQRKSIEELVGELSQSDHDEDKAVAATYKNLVEIAKKDIMKKYSRIDDVLLETGIPFTIIPGNYDGYGVEEVFRENNIHKKSKKIKDVKVAGYGGADVYAEAVVPRELIVNYSGEEAQKFLSKEKPQIAVLHNPPKGLCDLIGAGQNNLEGKDNTGEHIGNPEIVDYIEENSPKIVLSGHIHNSQGIEKFKDTYVINSGNLGRTANDKQAGMFYELDVDDKTGALKGAGVYQITDYATKKVEKLAEYKVEDGELRAYRTTFGKKLTDFLENVVEKELAKIQKIDMSEVPCVINARIGTVSHYINKDAKLKEKTKKLEDKKLNFVEKFFDNDNWRTIRDCNKRIAAANERTNKYKITKQLYKLNNEMFFLEKNHPELAGYRDKIVKTMYSICNKEPDAVENATYLINEIKTGLSGAYNKGPAEQAAQPAYA